MIVISKKTAAELTSYCRTKFPEEACGALIGYMDPINCEEMYITRFIPITNRSAHPTTSFCFDPKEWVSIVLGYEHQIQLIGTFHSHPTAPATPSVHDLDTAWGNLPAHLIVALELDQGEWFAYRHSKKRTEIESIVIEFR